LSPAIIFVAIRRLPVSYALVVAFLVLGHMSWLWGSLNNAILYLLECVVYYKGVRRGWNVFYTDLLYWLIIGIPLATFLTSNSGLELNALAGVIVLKQPLNGVLYTLLANVIIMAITIFRDHRIFATRLQLSSFIKDVLVTVLLIPLFSIFFLTKYAIERNLIDSTARSNDSYVQLTKNRVNEFLFGYQKAVQTLALHYQPHKDLTDYQKQALISQTHAIYSGFITMLVADQQGELVVASPAELIDKSRGVADREYFTFPKEMLHPFISEAFQGRGFGNDPIVAISAPIINEQGEFAGIVEGSLNLYDLDLLFVLPNSVEFEILIVDNSEQTIYASEGLHQNFLDKVVIQSQPDPLYKEVVTLNQDPTLYTVGFDTADNGWSIYFLAQRSKQVEALSQALLWLLLLGIISLIAILALSEWLSRKLHSPIDKLVKRFTSLSLTAQVDTETQNHLFDEIQLIFDQLDAAQEKLVAAHFAQQEALSDKISAEKQNEAKSELLSKVSHELRTPLNAILGQIQLLQLESFDESVSKQLAKAEQAGRFLVFLIEDLLVLSKSELGEFNLTLKHCYLNPLVEASTELFEQKIKDKDIQFMFDISATEDLVVNADEFRLQQAISNLISNAIKYNREGGRVTVKSTVIEDRLIKLTISDNGFGIPEQFQNKVFQPFNRLAHEHSKIEGSGIGLSLSYQLVRAMRGEIDFSSIENEGSHFTITMPVVKHPNIEAKAVEEELKLDLTGRKILYIEDNRTNFMIVQAWLKKQGATQIDNGDCAAAGLDKANTDRYDLILLDLGLPDRSGFEIIGELKALQPDVPIIPLTADGSEVSRERAEQLQVEEFLTKPVDFNQMTRVLYDLLN